MTESPTAVATRRQHERLLERVGRDSAKGQALLAQWAAEARAARSGRVPARRSRQMPGSILAVASVSRGKSNGHAPETDPVAEQIASPAGERYALVDVDLVDIAPNVRTVIDDASIDELAESIKSVGVLQPIRVRSAGDRFELVYGQRRLLAARKAGLGGIPAIVGDAGDDADPLEQLIENIQREDLNAIEQSRAIRQLLDADETLTQAAVGQLLGRSEPWVSNSLRLLELAEPVQQLVTDGKLSGAHAKAIAGLKNHANQVRLANQAVEYDYSVRSTEQHVSYQKGTDKTPAEQAESKRRKSERYAKKLIKALEAAGVPKDAQLVDPRLWELDGKVVYKVLADAGWKVAKDRAVGSYGYEPDKIGCDCNAYRYEDYNKAVVRVCVSRAHVDAWQAQVDGAAKSRQKELSDKAKRLTAVLERGLAGVDPTAARLTIATIGGHGLQELFKGKGDPWKQLEEIPDDRLPFELGELLAHRLVQGVDAERDWERINSAGLATAVNRLAAATAKKGKNEPATEPVETSA